MVSSLNVDHVGKKLQLKIYKKTVQGIYVIKSKKSRVLKAEYKSVRVQYCLQNKRMFVMYKENEIIFEEIELE